jgi:hypothetical protein
MNDSPDSKVHEWAWRFNVMNDRRITLYCGDIMRGWIDWYWKDWDCGEYEPTQGILRWQAVLLNENGLMHPLNTGTEKRVFDTAFTAACALEVALNLPGISYEGAYEAWRNDFEATLAMRRAKVAWEKDHPKPEKKVEPESKQSAPIFHRHCSHVLVCKHITVAGCPADCERYLDECKVTSTPLPASLPHVCPLCHGEGTRTIRYGFAFDGVPCRPCNGTGIVWSPREVKP